MLLGLRALVSHCLERPAGGFALCRAHPPRARSHALHCRRDPRGAQQAAVVNAPKPARAAQLSRSGQLPDSLEGASSPTEP